MRSALTSPVVKKLLASASLVGVVAAVAGLGSFATFTDSTSASHSVDSGTVSAALGAAGSTDNRLTIGAAAVAAGDTIQRVVKLSNTGTLDWAGAVLTTTASTSSPLDTDGADGLQMTIDHCSVPWTESGSAPAYTYTCGGSETQLVAARPVIASNLDLGSISSLAAGGSDHLRVKLLLPATADNTFQGQSSVIDFAFVGTQRLATDR
jgi:spore coat-associated protein N